MLFGAENGPVPQMTAIVATRNRGDSAVATVTSLLANDHPDFGVIVFDQSPEDDTEVSLRPFLDDPRFRYVRSDTVGLGRAQNQATALTESPYVAYTDDDCEVPPDWLTHLTGILDRHPDVGVVFTNVVAGPHDAEAGFVPGYERRSDAHVTTVWQKLLARGIGAGMAVRREPFQAMGGFDDHMGPGTVFPSGGDRDLAIRAVLAGVEVYETAGTAVVHHGYRTWEEGRQLTERDWIGLGAMCAKPLRAGHWTTVIYPAYELIVHAVLQPFRRLACGRRPQGFRRGLYFVRGFRQGWSWPMDRKHLVYLTADAPAVDTPAADTPEPS